MLLEQNKELLAKLSQLSKNLSSIEAKYNDCSSEVKILKKKDRKNTQHLAQMQRTSSEMLEKLNHSFDDEYKSKLAVVIEKARNVSSELFAAQLQQEVNTQKNIIAQLKTILCDVIKERNVFAERLNAESNVQKKQYKKFQDWSESSESSENKSCQQYICELRTQEELIEDGMKKLREQKDAFKKLYQQAKSEALSRENMGTKDSIKELNGVNKSDIIVKSSNRESCCSLKMNSVERKQQFDEVKTAIKTYVDSNSSVQAVINEKAKSFENVSLLFDEVFIFPQRAFARQLRNDFDSFILQVNKIIDFVKATTNDRSIINCVFILILLVNYIYFLMLFVYIIFAFIHFQLLFFILFHF